MFDSAWHFPVLDELPDSDLVAIGADLEPGTLVKAYQTGLFPMPVEERQIGWFWPIERGVFRQGDLVISRSLRRSLAKYTVTHDQAFDQVIEACADPDRPHGWIDDAIVEAYTRLHKLGVAHSVEVWDDQGLAGGLYGVCIGGLFAGESMFHRRTDASKVALVALTDRLWPHAASRDHTDSPGQKGSAGSAGHKSAILLDTQWATPHLSSLGAIEVDRPHYAKLLAQALKQSCPLKSQSLKSQSLKSQSLKPQSHGTE